MKSKRHDRGSTAGAVIATVAILAVVAFAGLRLNQSRTRLMGEVSGLQSELATTHARADELQKQVDAEHAARELAETRANEAGTAATQARDELQARQKTLNQRIQELEAGVQEYQQQVAAAVEARTRAEAALSREAGLRRAVEQDVAAVKQQLQERETLISELQQGAGSGGSSVAKQKFDDETAAGAGPAFDTPPKAVELVSPEYPPTLKQRGTEGNVVVAFTVDTQGRVQDVEVREATNDEFEAAAVAAVSKWRFTPALRDGQPVAVHLVQRLDFTRSRN